MSIQQIPFEQGRFWVSSRSRPEMLHVVDLDWDDGEHKPRGMCSCEQCMAKDNRICAHLVAVVDYERERLHI